MNTHTEADGNQRLGCATRILLAVGGLVVLLYASYLGVRAMHFSTAPDFSSYLAAYPVADADWRALAYPQGEVPTAQAYFGAVDPKATTGGERASLAAHCEIGRDGSVLVDVAAHFEGVLDPQTGDLRGLTIFPSVTTVAAGLRPIVVVTIEAPADERWATERVEPRVWVDFLAVAGTGPPELVVVRPSAPGPYTRPGLDRWFPSSNADLLEHTLRPPNPTGLIHHARVEARLNWDLERRTEVDLGLAVAPNDYQYSWDYAVNVYVTRVLRAMTNPRHDVRFGGKTW